MDFNIENKPSWVEQHFQEDGPSLEMELIILKSDLTLKGTISFENNLWPPVLKYIYPTLVHIALCGKALFCSTYLCESPFLTMKIVENKFRNRLTDHHHKNCIEIEIIICVFIKFQYDCKQKKMFSLNKFIKYIYYKTTILSLKRVPSFLRLCHMLTICNLHLRTYM